jgi:hypothetical protein
MSRLSWIDYDASRANQALRHFDSLHEHDARDELGLGGVRDTFSDLFFPGTSTIQTRVRYFLFVPWCCAAAAQKGTTPENVLVSLRSNEVRLIKTLQMLGAGEQVIGFEKGEDLARMPSEVYWNGLQVLGIRRGSGGIARWAWRLAKSRQITNELPALEDKTTVLDNGFDKEMPPPPRGFPDTKGLQMALEPDEAAYLRYRFENAAVNKDAAVYSLFSAMLRSTKKKSSPMPWQDVRLQNLPSEPADLLALGKAFSNVMAGAVLAYNFAIADLKSKDSDNTRGTVDDRYRAAIQVWAETLSVGDCEVLSRRMDELPTLGAIARHRIGSKTLNFVRDWLAFCEKPLGVQAQAIVRNREIELKKRSGTSRFLNVKARERWRGVSGGELSYRWGVASKFVDELSTI